MGPALNQFLPFEVGLVSSFDAWAGTACLGKFNPEPDQVASTARRVSVTESPNVDFVTPGQTCDQVLSPCYSHCRMRAVPQRARSTYAKPVPENRCVGLVISLHWLRRLRR